MNHFVETLKSVLEVVLSDCSFITLESVEFVEGTRQTVSATFNVTTELLDVDFEPVDSEPDSDVEFIEEYASCRACQILFAYLVGNNKVDFLGVKTIQVPSGTNRIERRNVLRFFLKPIDGHHFFYNEVARFNVWNRDDLGFDVFDAIYDKKPFIKVEYSPASFDKSQGEPGGWSPESYEYECFPATVVFPVRVEFDIGFDYRFVE